MVKFLAFDVGRYVQPQVAEPTIALAATKWDDWGKFRTEFVVMYISPDGTSRQIGATKIGQRGLVGSRSAHVEESGVIHRAPVVPAQFESLSRDHYFSLGQDEKYYENLTVIGGGDLRDRVLQGLRDVAYDVALLEEVSNEEVLQESLLRSVPITTVQGQYADLAHGREATRRSYQFKFAPSEDNPDESFQFQVIPNSLPPTNVHVVIGRNGVGKTTALMSLARAMYAQSRTSSPAPSNQLANLVTVSYSAFDLFKHPEREEAKPTAHALTYKYVGLREPSSGLSFPQPPDALLGTPDRLKNREELANDLANSLRVCLSGARLRRLRRALEMLEVDPIFSETSIRGIIGTKEPDLAAFEDEKEAAVDATVSNVRQVFLHRLSSGHAIALLTMVQLVESVHERTLVIMDEPEAHLHPPLLSALIRAVSDLLIAQNGMAIISTHSPVVLQEVPRSCVSVMRRSGSVMTIQRPQRETFGENVGTLTDEVFGLEVEATGFHTILRNAATQASTYEEALSLLGGQLGVEGRGILRAFMMNRAFNDDVVS